MKIILAVVLVVLIAVVMSVFRRLPTRAEEAKAHAEAVEGLLVSLQTSLPAIDPITAASTRVAAWGELKPSNGRISIDPAELRETVTQIEQVRQTVMTARAAWTAAAAEAKIHTTKLESLLGDAVWPDQLGNVFRTSRDLLLLLGWPVAFVIVLAYFVHSDQARKRIVELAKSVQKVVLPGGVELTLWKEEFRQNQSETFSRFRTDVQAEYDKLVERHTIRDTLNRILKDTIEPELKRIKNGKAVDYRATIHVRDALFKNTYYQLVDYQPTGGNRGRAWSVRFGMVGRAWRLEKDSWNGQVGTADQLIENWGMTRDESQIPGRQSMLCCILKTDTGTPVGAIYMDANSKEEFGSEAEMAVLAGKVQHAAKASGLTASLEAVWEEIKKKAPLVEVYGNRT